VDYYLPLLQACVNYTHTHPHSPPPPPHTRTHAHTHAHTHTHTSVMHLCTHAGLFFTTLRKTFSNKEAAAVVYNTEGA
jgi:hypothetical protein